MTPHLWTKEEADSYLATRVDQRTLPVDLDDVDPGSDCVVVWIFNASQSDGLLPELELDPMPDFVQRPAMCVFDMDGAGKAALIPSGFLEMRTTGPNRVQFVLNERGTSVDQFVHGGDAASKLSGGG